jgi:hypothetical protein
MDGAAVVRLRERTGSPQRLGLCSLKPSTLESASPLHSNACPADNVTLGELAGHAGDLEVLAAELLCGTASRRFRHQFRPDATVSRASGESALSRKLA